MQENADQKNWKYRHFSRSVIFSDILLENRTLTGDTMVVSQAQMRKDEWVQGVEANKGVKAYEGDL